MQKIIIRSKETKRPISDETIGFRLQAAIPNQEARKMRAVRKKGELVGFAATDKMTTAFTKQYLVFESSDSTSLNERDLDRFKGNLKCLGFTHYQWAGKDEVAAL